tara:strand:- start:718 stop:903 length:186 start_codon:yes stop_codon:yes gene_type:complete
MSLKRKKANTYFVCGHLLSPGESVNVSEGDLDEWARKLQEAGILRILKTSRPGIVQVLHVT